jgi:hypothetical protein
MKMTFPLNDENTNQWFDRRIICGFPGVGKSQLVKSINERYSGKRTIDADAEVVSKYHWIDNDRSKGAQAEWPNNYLDFIKKCANTYEYVFVSTHTEILDALCKSVLENNVLIVTPSIDRYDEFMVNYENRGTSPELRKRISDNWEKWITALYDRNLPVITLEKGEFMKDAYHQILWNKYNDL